MTLPLWTGSEFVEALGARVAGRVPGAITGVSIDTRTLAAGDVFFAIQGENRDGHAFVGEALKKGAAAAVVSTDQAANLAGLEPLVTVPDVLAALTAAGRQARARTAARVAAITGSVGKTGTKEALRLALASQGVTHASAASYNNHWGVPLSLARMPRQADYGIFEIGMSASGEITPLTRLVRPEVAIVTTVAPVHLEFFPSVAAIADAKGEIFAGLEPGGTAIINRDNEQFERLRAHAAASRAGRIVSFGEHESADIRAERIITLPELSVVEARIFGTPITYRIGTPGRHIALNSLAVLAAVKALGADLALAALALANLVAPVGRGQRTRLMTQGGEFLLIDESYNANPASMRAALATLGQTPVGLRGRRIAVLADMLELGPDAADLHRALAGTIVESGVDLVFAAGQHMHNLWRELDAERRGAYAERPADIGDDLIAAIRAGDAVMVKGSNGTRVSAIVARLKERFPAATEAEATA